MAGWWQKTMGYLGLNDDDSYDYEPYDEPPAAQSSRRPPAAPPTGESLATVRTIAQPSADSGVGAIVPQRPATSTNSSGSVRTVTPVLAQQKVHVVSPTSFGEAQEIGERFRGAQPVIINLTAVDRDLARRLVDFASGLAYGLNGAMKKVSDKVFMLTPADYEVSADEKRRLREKGLIRS